MSGKSGRRRHMTRSKRKQGGQSPSTEVARQPIVAPAHEAVVLPRVSIPSASVPPVGATLTTVLHPHVVSELRRIGILAGIILVILVVIAQVLP